MENFVDGALLITSIALIVSVILQSKGAGLGGFTGSDSGTVFTARRGIEKTLFWVTIGLSILFFILAVVTVIIKGFMELGFAEREGFSLLPAAAAIAGQYDTNSSQRQPA